MHTITRTETTLELMLELQPEEALEWKAEVNQQYTDWRDVESAAHLVSLIQGIFGRYAQAVNTGSGYQVEVAQICRGTTRNWRVGLGSASDEAGNTPFEGVSASQNLTLAGTSEVMVSWLNGHGLPLGYGAALHVYE